MRWDKRLGAKLIGLPRQVLSKLVPQEYLEDRQCRRTLYRWLLLGLSIRMFFMPFAAHGDLMAYNWMAHFIISHRAFDIVGFLQASGSSGLINTPFILYFQAFFLFIFAPVMPGVFTRMGTNFSYGAFITDPHVSRALFLLKAPYFFLDLGIALLLLRMFKNKAHGTYAWKFWMVSPIVIFAVYIFSSYDVLVAFLILLSLYYMKINWRKSSAFVLGMGAAAKLFPLLLAPFLILSSSKSKLKQLGYVALFCVPLILVFIPNIVRRTTYAIPSLFAGNPEGYLFGMRFNVGFFDTIFVVVAAYAVIGLGFYFRKERNWELLWRYCYIVMLGYYATSLFHPQYFMWIMPLTALAVVTDKRFLKLHIMQILCFVVYTFNWGRGLAFGLFQPFSSLLGSLPAPAELISRFVPSGPVIDIFRSVFSGVSIYMIYLMVKQLREIQTNDSEGSC